MLFLINILSVVYDFCILIAVGICRLSILSVSCKLLTASSHVCDVSVTCVFIMLPRSLWSAVASKWLDILLKQSTPSWSRRVNSSLDTVFQSFGSAAGKI